ncbi:hypothetical protein [Frigoriglobus tundricola]|uniref:Uncharacterized protein n=1 Tax=Frigoriglobus tundricola TaxID=2774151 RepID=A0A6M5YQ05_9BACT|nr:hypothetical protein [Frigoriglobus tundricola]QJW95383.1 hypothetical protein FTUN_2932 [Frigoriglobus tundricola]
MFRIALVALLAGLASASTARVRADEPPTQADQPVFTPTSAALMDGEAATSATVQRLMKRAKQLKADKEYERATDALLAVLEIDDEHLGALTELAWVCNERKEYKAAAAAAFKAVKVDEDSVDGWRELGFALMKVQMHKEAVQALSIAIKLDGKQATLRDYRALAYEGLGDDELAQVDRLKATQLRRAGASPLKATQIRRD